MAAVPSPAPCLRPVRVVAFDTGGVITDSARSRTAAWEQASDTRLPECEVQRPRRASVPSTTAPNGSMSPVRDGLGRPGRPDPALLGEVARSLHVAVRETAVVEDSFRRVSKPAGAADSGSWSP